MSQRTPNRFRLDDRVFLTMLAVSVLALCVLAFRYKSYEPCRPVSLIARDSVYFTDVPIQFRAESKGAETFEWNFGDGTPHVRSTSATVFHTFRGMGSYQVTVTVNGKCTQWKKIVVKKAQEVYDAPAAPEFSGPDSAYVNTFVTFTDRTLDATSWEWKFEESDNTGNSDRTASYRYTTPGPKTVFLRINGRSDRASTRMIYVKEQRQQSSGEKEDKTVKKKQDNGRNWRDIEINKEPDTPPPPPPPEQKKAPEISTGDLAAMLKQVASGKKTAADFSEYLCGNTNIEVYYNDRKMSFTEMCETIRKVKREKKIKSLEVQKLYKSPLNCILSLSVDLDKKGLFN